MKLPFKLPAGLTRAAGKLWLKTKNARPEIFVVSGIICGGAAVVMTAVQTWKGKETLAKDISVIKVSTKNGAEKCAEEHPDWPKMTEEDRKLFKKFSGSIKRHIDEKKELLEALEEKYVCTD